MAQDGGADPDAFPLTVKVGQVVSLCATGTIVCPAGVAICDDPSVAVPGTAEGGLVLRGVKPGKTLCSARSAQGLGALRLYRVEVVEAKR
jgi:hypothetical protein